MIITKNINKYLAYAEDSVLDTLKKIEKNNARIVFVVSEDSVLLGVVSDGDVRRWLVESTTPNLSVPVYKMMHKSVRSLPIGADSRRVSMLFKRGVECIPLVDEHNRLAGLAFQKTLSIEINGREISDRVPSFVIAEIGNNHQGDIILAKKLVDHAVSAGADCAKFQMRDTASLYQSKAQGSDFAEDLSTQYTLDLLERFQLRDDELFEVFDYCYSQGIIPLCTPWDFVSLARLEEYGMPAYKLASADFTNHQLIEAVARTGKPMFCSTGMCSEQEIFESVELLRSLSSNFILLHCNSTYPAPYKDINLNYMKKLADISGGLVGYSGHERGYEVPVAAVAMGAVIIEKHLSTDRQLEGADHKVSLLPDEFTSMVQSIRRVEAALGGEHYSREVSQGELINRENLAKSLFASADIAAGSVITRDIVEVKSPGKGLQPNKINLLVGQTANRDIKKGDCFYKTDIVGTTAKKERYGFSRPYGVPVRYHDFKVLSNDVHLDLLEFHMSYKDIYERPSEHLRESINARLAVHCPELFEGDHILDLASFDGDYRKKSIENLDRVVDTTKDLSTFFLPSNKPVLVLNAGGWDRKQFLQPCDVEKKYQILSSSLEEIDFTNVSLAIQTMPPFPWHFGGQSHHNLFVSPSDIASFCENHSEYGICLDISHSVMACNYFGWNIYQFIEMIGRYVVHLHISDAKGIDGEGVEIGLGDVDFIGLAACLRENCPGIGFIPEIWQGHKNKGEGFWEALNFLEATGL